MSRDRLSRFDWLSRVHEVQSTYGKCNPEIATPRGWTARSSGLRRSRFAASEAMLALRLEMRLPNVGRCAEVVDLWHTRFRARVARSSDLVYDDAIVGRIPVSPQRRRIVVILDGRAYVHAGAGSSELGPAEFRVAPQEAVSSMRNEGRPYRFLAFDWHEDFIVAGGPGGDGKLGTADVERLRALADTMADSWNEPEVLASTVERAWNVLVAAGAVKDRLEARELREPVPRGLSALSRALCDVGGRMQAGPTIVDVESRLGMSRRHVARLFQDMASRYGVDGASWRQTIDLWRLRSAVALLTHPDARTAQVARAVGYASPEALCHAFARAGLPSPGRIRMYVDTLV
jgi:AraC-like DNA-binding protein